MMEFDGNKTYLLAAGVALFGIFVFWNDYQMHGYVQPDAIKYIGGMLASAGALVTGRSALKTLEK